MGMYASSTSRRKKKNKDTPDTTFAGMRGGVLHCKCLGTYISGDLCVAPFVDVSGMATSDRVWADSQKIPLSLGGFKVAMR